MLQLYDVKKPEIVCPLALKLNSTVLVVRVALGPQFDSVTNSLYPVVNSEDNESFFTNVLS